MHSILSVSLVVCLVAAAALASQSAAVPRRMGFVPNVELRKELRMEERRFKYSGVDLPASFDARQQWPHCIHSVEDQEQCGDCWAFGAEGHFSDRFCIATSGQQVPLGSRLSVQELTSCTDGGLEGCNGGDPVSALLYISSFGLTSAACIPFTSGGGETGWCPDGCTNSTASWKKYYGDLFSLSYLDGVEAMQESLMSDGPIEACFDVYEDFMNYTSGVYSYQTGELLGGHCIHILGWGVTPANVPYWIARNSWGNSWGLSGDFWILRGQDECGIEAESYSIKPDVSKSRAS